MASSVYSSGTLGNLINGVSVAHGTTVAAFLDLSTSIEGQVICEVTTGSSAPTAGTAFSVYKAYATGTSAPITLTSGASSGATSLSVSSTAGLHYGQQIALVSASTGLGELVTINAAVSSSPISVVALVGSYSSGDHVYYIGQTATFSATPANATGGWAANKDYSVALFLGASQWIIAANNTDSTQTVTVSATVDKVTGFA